VTRQSTISSARAAKLAELWYRFELAPLVQRTLHRVLYEQILALRTELRDTFGSSKRGCVPSRFQVAVSDRILCYGVPSCGTRVFNTKSHKRSPMKSGRPCSESLVNVTLSTKVPSLSISSKIRSAVARQSSCKIGDTADRFAAGLGMLSSGGLNCSVLRLGGTRT
jgi:hypothetical protein